MGLLCLTCLIKDLSFADIVTFAVSAIDVDKNKRYHIRYFVTFAISQGLSLLSHHLNQFFPDLNLLFLLYLIFDLC